MSTNPQGAAPILLTLAVLLVQGVGTTSAAAEPALDLAGRKERIHQLLGPPGRQAQLDAADRGLLLDPTLRRVAAFRLWQQLPQVEREAMRRLFSPPDTSGCLTSERFPVRVCYRDLGEQDLARVALAEAEEAWALEVEELGFWAPRRQGEQGPEYGIDLHFEDTASIGAGGYTSPVDLDVTTPQLDCLTFIALSETALPGEELRLIVRHEFNHACQMAMDCTETLNSMEATASWIEPNLDGGSSSFFEAVIQAFQSQPERSVGSWDYESIYPYGASLFLQFVQERLGDDDPKSIARLWQATVQYSEDNEPDLLDAISDLAATKGLTLQDLLLEFGQWRYFLGQNDDGRHFRNGGAWRGAEVRLSGRYDLTGTRPEPVAVTLQLEPLGYAFAELQLEGEWAEGAQLVFTPPRGMLARGLAELWLLQDGQLAQRLPAYTVPEGEDAEPAEREPRPLAVDATQVAAADRAVLMVAQVREEVDWDQDWRKQNVSYGLDALFPPALLQVDPTRLTLGQTATLKVKGAQLGPETRLEVLTPGLELDTCSLDGPDELHCAVTVSRDAEPGPVGLRLVNEVAGFTLQAERNDLLELVPPAVPRLTALAPDRGEPGTRPIVRATGEDLPEDLTPDQLDFTCPGLEVLRVVRVEAGMAYLYLEIEAAAQPGTCDLVLEDRFARRTELSAAFTLYVAGTGEGEGEEEGEGEGQPEPDDDPEESDGCNLAGAGQVRGFWPVLGRLLLGLRS